MRAAVLTIAFVAPLLVGAAQEPVPSTAAQPALIQSVVMKDSDSPLVRAAKAALAKRQGGAHASVTRVDNEQVKHASGNRVSEPTQPLQPVPRPALPESHGGTPVIPPPPFDRAGAEKQLSDLKAEESRLAEEADQPYGNIEEDYVAKRMSEIRSQQESLRKSLDAHPSPTPTP